MRVVQIEIIEDRRVEADLAAIIEDRVRRVGVSVFRGLGLLATDVPLPLEATYQTTWQVFPTVLKGLLEGYPRAPGGALARLAAPLRFGEHPLLDARQKLVR